MKRCFVAAIAAVVHIACGDATDVPPGLDSSITVPPALDGSITVPPELDATMLDTNLPRPLCMGEEFVYLEWTMDGDRHELCRSVMRSIGTVLSDCGSFDACSPPEPPEYDLFFELSAEHDCDEPAGYYFSVHLGIYNGDLSTGLSGDLVSETNRVDRVYPLARQSTERYADVRLDLDAPGCRRSGDPSAYSTGGTWRVVAGSDADGPIELDAQGVSFATTDGHEIFFHRIYWRGRLRDLRMPDAGLGRM